VLVRDDVSPSAWQTQSVKRGAAGPGDNRWGIWLTVRPASGNGTSWVGAGYTLQSSCSSFAVPCAGVEPRFFWFGRERDDPLAADLSITMADAPDQLVVGSLLTYTMTVANNGPAPATSVTLTDPFPAGANLVSLTASQGACVGSTTITCSLGTVPVGAQVQVTAVVTAAPVGILFNTATVAGRETDPDPANNSATQSTTVSRPACQPRPAITTAVRPGVPGTLQVTLTALTSAGAPATRLQALVFGNLANASVEIGALPPPTSGSSVFLADRPAALSFLVHRVTAGQATTVPITVVDDCGGWSTFVGGGPAAF
jgi:uncharacterized repeat protein (TIGR01451 family)